MRFRAPVPQKQTAWSYLLPFFILAASATLLFLVAQLFFFDSNTQKSLRSGAIITIEKGETKALLSGQSQFVVAPNGTKLFTGERVQTGIDGGAVLRIGENTTFRLDGGTEIDLSKIEIKKSTEKVVLALQNGRMWVSQKRIANPDSQFRIQTPRLLIETRGGQFSVEPASVRVAAGSVELSVLDGKKPIASATIGVGQEFFLSDDLFAMFRNGDSEIEPAALSDDFKLSPWYRINMGQTSGIDTSTQMEKNRELGLLENGSESGASVHLETTSTGAQIISTIPQILKPTTNGEVVSLPFSESIEISGTVPFGTAGVEVNEYRLQKFSVGDTSWRYLATIAGGNLKIGENRFAVRSLSAEGGTSDAATIMVIISQKPRSGSGEMISGVEVFPPTVPRGVFAITEPNGGRETVISGTKVDIRGTAPTNAHKIVVNGYTLQNYESGALAWRYIAAEQFGNLTIGTANSYTVAAFDVAGRKIAEETMVITAQKTAFSAPILLQPSATGLFETTDSTIEISGTASVQTARLWLNGVVLGGFSAGDTTFSATVSLEKGENHFSIVAEDGNGAKSAASTILLFRK